MLYEAVTGGKEAARLSQQHSTSQHRTAQHTTPHHTTHVLYLSFPHLEAADSEGSEASSGNERRTNCNISGAEKKAKIRGSRGKCGHSGGAVEEREEEDEDEGCAGGLHSMFTISLKPFLVYRLRSSLTLYPTSLHPPSNTWNACLALIALPDPSRART